jgi:hypothetical protein
VVGNPEKILYFVVLGALEIPLLFYLLLVSFLADSPWTTIVLVEET